MTELLNVVVIVTAAAVGLTIHEVSHYTACRLVGASASPVLYYRNLAEWGPAVRTELRHHTPTTLRIVSLAPLVMLVPVAVEYARRPDLFAEPRVAVGLAMWCVTALPSPVDIYNAYHAGEVDSINAVAYGTHPRHAAAEGI